MEFARFSTVAVAVAVAVVGSILTVSRLLAPLLCSCPEETSPGARKSGSKNHCPDPLNTLGRSGSAANDKIRGNNEHQQQERAQATRTICTMAIRSGKPSQCQRQALAFSIDCQSCEQLSEQPNRAMVTFNRRADQLMKLCLNAEKGSDAQHQPEFFRIMSYHSPRGVKKASCTPLDS
jgi:hypothetical protein